MRTICLAATAALLISSVDGVSAADTSRGGGTTEGHAATAGGRGQNQAAPSSEANPPAIAVPTEADTTGGQGQNQAAPSSEAQTPVIVQPGGEAGGTTTGGATTTECPPAGSANAQGADRSGEVGNKPGC